MTIQGIANHQNFPDAHSTQPRPSIQKSQYNKGIIVASIATGTLIAGALAINSYMLSKTPNLPISTTRPSPILISRKIDIVLTGSLGLIFGGLIGAYNSWSFFLTAAPHGHYPMVEKPYLCAGVITVIHASLGCMFFLNELF